MRGRTLWSGQECKEPLPVQNGTLEKRLYSEIYVYGLKKKAILADGRVGRCIDMKSERAKQL